MAKNSMLGRRTTAILYLLGVGILIAVLIAYEQIPILYVLATLSIVALLLIVGFADLEKVGVDGDDNASLGA
ncbi:MAG: hypothetical protein QM785_12215 [Pyrinomonadaceae bacterium]